MIDEMVSQNYTEQCVPLFPRTPWTLENRSNNQRIQYNYMYKMPNRAMQKESLGAVESWWGEGEGAFQAVGTASWCRNSIAYGHGVGGVMGPCSYIGGDTGSISWAMISLSKQSQAWPGYIRKTSQENPRIGAGDSFSGKHFLSHS